MMAYPSRIQSGGLSSIVDYLDAGELLGAMLEADF